MAGDTPRVREDRHTKQAMVDRNFERERRIGIDESGKARHVHERSTARREVRKNRQEDQQGKISKGREKGRKIVERVVVVLAL